MKHLFLSEATEELRETVDHYENEKEALGREFSEEVESTVQRVLDHPEWWPSLCKRFRVCKTKRFPYGLIYEVREQELFIVAVMHLHRKPGYWRRRI